MRLSKIGGHPVDALSTEIPLFLASQLGCALFGAVPVTTCRILANPAFVGLSASQSAQLGFPLSKLNGKGWPTS